MADDQEQKRLEVFKMRMDFLKHITTLSGVATVIVLTLIQRAQDPVMVASLAFIAFMFVQSVVIAIGGIWASISTFEDMGLEKDPRVGKWVSAVASGMFGAGILCVVEVAFRIPLIPTLIVSGVVLGVMYAILIAGLVVRLRRRKIPAENAQDDSVNYSSRVHGQERRSPSEANLVPLRGCMLPVYS